MPAYNKDALALMRDDGLISIKTFRDDDDHIRREYTGLRKPDMSVFSENERAIIDSTLDSLKDCSTNSLVRMSHDLSWAVRDDGEEIKFETYVGKLNLTPEQKKKERYIIEEAELAYEV